MHLVKTLIVLYTLFPKNTVVKKALKMNDKLIVYEESYI